MVWSGNMIFHPFKLLKSSTWLLRMQPKKDGVLFYSNFDFSKKKINENKFVWWKKHKTNHINKTVERVVFGWNIILNFECKIPMSTIHFACTLRLVMKFFKRKRNQLNNSKKIHCFHNLKITT